MSFTLTCWVAVLSADNHLQQSTPEDFRRGLDLLDHKPRSECFQQLRAYSEGYIALFSLSAASIQKLLHSRMGTAVHLKTNSS